MKVGRVCVMWLFEALSFIYVFADFVFHAPFVLMIILDEEVVKLEALSCLSFFLQKPL